VLKKTESNSKKIFYTPEWLAKDQARRLQSPRGPLLIASCRSGSDLAGRVVKRYNDLLLEAGSIDKAECLQNIDERFSDTESTVRIHQNVNGYDVFLIQAPFDPESGRSVDQNLMAFFIAVRAFREHGARYITGILPYLPYARQDKPTRFKREPTTAKLMADLSIESGIDRLITWDPHAGQIKGFYGKTPVNMLESLTLFLEAFENYRGRDDVIAVAPDAGASKFVTAFGRAMNLNSAIASKYRPQPEQVVISEIIGNFQGKKIAIILDDMISRAGTIDALIKKLHAEKTIREFYVGVSHNLCVGDGYSRLVNLHKEYNLKKVIVTNSIPQTQRFLSLPFVEVLCLSEFLSRVINRLHYGKSVSEVFYRPSES
jgi:ribose-phosphate pyrophosphokinase